MGDNNLILNADQAQFSASGNSTMTVADFSSTVFKVVSAAQTNSTDDFIAYCFSEVEGYSKIGSWTGNGSSNGPFIYTGFRPVYILHKDTNSTQRWQIKDTTRDPDNPNTKFLQENNTAEEDNSNSSVDFLSNGFKIRTSDGNHNTNGNIYIYLAFAESPFKYARAR